MDFSSILKRIFGKRGRMVCGGEGCVSVTDRLGREVGRFYYRRPTSNEVLDYVYAEQTAIGSEAQLRELAATDTKKQIEKIHAMLTRDLWLPWAEKIFIRSTGYFSGKREPLDKLSTAEQFGYLKEYYAHQLVDMCSLAFQREGSVKKKF